MPGILDKTLNTTEFGIKTTSELREILLGRNLPPPVPEAIKDSKFATLTAHQGNVINVDDVGNENIRAVYELNKLEGRLLEQSSAYERELLNLKNRYKPLNGYPTFEVIYTPYINAIAASLNYDFKDIIDTYQLYSKDVMRIKNIRILIISSLEETKLISKIQSMLQH